MIGFGIIKAVATTTSHATIKEPDAPVQGGGRSKIVDVSKACIFMMHADGMILGMFGTAPFFSPSFIFGWYRNRDIIVTTKAIAGFGVYFPDGQFRVGQGSRLIRVILQVGTVGELPMASFFG